MTRITRVEAIAEDGKSNSVEVCPDLMRVASMGHGGDQGVALEPFKHFHLGGGGLAFLWVDYSAVPPVAVDAQGQVDGLLVPVGPPAEESVVGLGDLALLELSVQPAVGFGRPRQHNDATGLFIQAVHHPTTTNLLGEQGAQVGELRIGAIADGKQPRWFVDYNQGVVDPQDGYCQGFLLQC